MSMYVCFVAMAHCSNTQTTDVSNSKLSLQRYSILFMASPTVTTPNKQKWNKTEVDLHRSKDSESLMYFCFIFQALYCAAAV